MIVLKRYVDNKTLLQLEVLYAFQIAVAKIEHPPSEYGEEGVRETDRWTDGRTDRQTDQQTNRQSSRQADKQVDRQTPQQTQTGRQTDRQRGRQADKKLIKQRREESEAIAIRVHLSPSPSRAAQ